MAMEYIMRRPTILTYSFSYIGAATGSNNAAVSNGNGLHYQVFGSNIIGTVPSGYTRIELYLQNRMSGDGYGQIADEDALLCVISPTKGFPNYVNIQNRPLIRNTLDDSGLTAVTTIQYIICRIDSNDQLVMFGRNSGQSSRILYSQNPFVGIMALIYTD